MTAYESDCYPDLDLGLDPGHYPPHPIDDAYLDDPDPWDDSEYEWSRL